MQLFLCHYFCSMSGQNEVDADVKASYHSNFRITDLSLIIQATRQNRLGSYGVVPFREKLFSERSKVWVHSPSTGFLSWTANIAKHRTYFDSADFALKAAHSPSEISEKNTGTEHPQHASISHPFCAVPSSSNVFHDANNGFQTTSHEIKKCQSHLHENEKADCEENEGGFTIKK